MLLCLRRRGRVHTGSVSDGDAEAQEADLRLGPYHDLLLHTVAAMCTGQVQKSAHWHVRVASDCLGTGQSAEMLKRF